MAANISPTVRHELRNHLNNISVNSELLKLLITQESGNDRMRKCIDTVLKECNACTELINNERHRESPSESSNG